MQRHAGTQGRCLSFETLSHGFTEPHRASLAAEGGFCKLRQQQLGNRQFTEPAVPHQAAPSSEGKAQLNDKQTPEVSKTQAGRSTGRAEEAGESHSSTNSGLFVKGRIL